MWEIFERSEQIFCYLWIFMVVITVFSIAIIWSISQFITKPILLLAEKIQQIEQIDPEEIVLEKNISRRHWNWNKECGGQKNGSGFY